MAGPRENLWYYRWQGHRLSKPVRTSRMATTCSECQEWNRSLGICPDGLQSYFIPFTTLLMFVPLKKDSFSHPIPYKKPVAWTFLLSLLSLLNLAALPWVPEETSGLWTVLVLLTVWGLLRLGLQFGLWDSHEIIVKYNGLNMKCPSQAHILNVWSLAWCVNVKFMGTDRETENRQMESRTDE